MTWSEDNDTGPPGSGQSASNPKWIFSEDNYPKNSESVILFDGQRCRVRKCEELKKNTAVISKIPSRWTRTVHVYSKGNPILLEDESYLLTSKKGQQDGLRWMSTIHLEKLPWNVRAGVFTRQIEWIFITNTGSRSSTESKEDWVNAWMRFHRTYILVGLRIFPDS